MMRFKNNEMNDSTLKKEITLSDVIKILKIKNRLLLLSEVAPKN